MLPHPSYLTHYSVLVVLLILVNMGLTMMSVQVAALIKVVKILVRFWLRWWHNWSRAIHQVTVAVQFLYADVHILFASQLSLISSELHLVACSVSLVLSPIFSFFVQSIESLQFSASLCIISSWCTGGSISCWLLVWFRDNSACKIPLD